MIISETFWPVLSPAIPADEDEDGFTPSERAQIVENVFECHGFFPDLRSESQLPESVKKMRDQPKSSGELAAIKSKYAQMSEADAAFTMLLDLGLMEDYDKLGEYSDDFPDDAM